MSSSRSRRNASVLLLLGLFAAPPVACHRPKRTKSDAMAAPARARTITASCNGISRSGTCRQLTMSPPSLGGDPGAIDRFLPTAENECRTRRLPVAYLHARWCGPCRAIDAHKDEPSMAKAFSGTHVVAIDLDGADEDELHRLGIETSRLPVFYVLDVTGRATAEKIDGGAWGENVPENMAPPLGRFFAARAMAESMKRDLEAHPNGRAGQKVTVGRGQAQQAAVGDRLLTDPRARR